MKSGFRLARSLRPRLPAPRSIRAYATISPDTPPPQAAYEVFEEPSKWRQRDRALRRLRETSGTEGGAGDGAGGSGVGVVDYLREELAERLAERVEDLKTPPSRILELASHAGQLTKVLQEVVGGGAEDGASGEARREWYMVEPSGEALNRDTPDTFYVPPKRIQASPSSFLVHPEVVPLREQLDMVVSAGGLHWVGDIVGTLTQIRHVLKPDGVFIGAVLGGDTLFELRTSIQLAEQERRGGLANRISPMINPTDGPSLLNRAGFTLTTVDVEEITINYPSMWELMSDIRDMGESNAILGRKAMISRDVLIAAEAIYKDLYQKEEGSIPATFQVIFMIGWKPGPTQPQPLARGSGQTNLKDILS